MDSEITIMPIITINITMEYHYYLFINSSDIPRLYMMQNKSTR